MPESSLRRLLALLESFDRALAREPVGQPEPEDGITPP